MIPIPSGVKIWLATGQTDMRKGFGGLALVVQEVLERGVVDAEQGQGPLEALNRQDHAGADREPVEPVVGVAHRERMADQRWRSMLKGRPAVTGS